jgi:hypothetical protein
MNQPCLNCGKESTTDFCSQECAKQYKEKTESARLKRKTSTKVENGKVTINKEPTVNIGTNAKCTLQEQALRFIKKYPDDQTARDYACLLCWDIRVSQRTALENYIEPMIKHGILVPSGENRYSLNSEYKENE